MVHNGKNDVCFFGQFYVLQNFCFLVSYIKAGK